MGVTGFAMIIQYVYVETYHKVESSTTALTGPLSVKTNVSGLMSLEGPYLPTSTVDTMVQYGTIGMDRDDIFCNDNMICVCRNIPQSRMQSHGFDCPAQRQDKKCSSGWMARGYIPI